MNVIVKYDLPDNLTVNVVEGHSTVVNILPRSPIIVNICDGTGGFISDYANLAGKPRVNNVELNGNKTLSELGIEPKRGADDNYVTSSEKSQGALATGVANPAPFTGQDLSTLKKLTERFDVEINNKAEEDGFIAYHKAIWTDAGSISITGNVVTGTNTAFTSAMVGSKLKLANGWYGIITTFTSAVSVTIDKSVEGTVTAGNGQWGVHSKAIEVSSEGNCIIYGINCQITARFSYWGTFSMTEFYQTANLFSIQDTFRANKDFWFQFSNTNVYTGVKDTGFKRNSAGKIEFNDGVTTGNYRDIIVRNLDHTGTINQTSDARLKENITDVNNASDKLLQLGKCVKHFNYKDKVNYTDEKQTWLIAQLLLKNGFEGHVKQREPRNEEEGLLLGWTYKDESYEEPNEQGEIEVKTRRVVDKKGDMIYVVERNFEGYIIKALAETIEKNRWLETRLAKLEKLLLP